jgi:hypothetical protein
VQFFRAQSVGRHQLEAKAPARIRQCIHQSQDVRHLQGCGDGLWGPGAPHIGRKILRGVLFLAQPLLLTGPAQLGSGALHLVLAGAASRFVRPDLCQALEQLFRVLRWSGHRHGSQHVLHVVPIDPFPGRALDLPAEQLVVTKGFDQLGPVLDRKGCGRSAALRATTSAGGGGAGGCELRRDLDQRPSGIHQIHRQLHPECHRLDRIAMEWGARPVVFFLRPHLRQCSTGRSLDDSERSNLFGSPAETGRETPRFGSSPPSHGSAPCETFREKVGPTAWHALSGAVSRWQP